MAVAYYDIVATEKQMANLFLAQFVNTREGRQQLAQLSGARRLIDGLF